MRASPTKDRRVSKYKNVEVSSLKCHSYHGLLGPHTLMFGYLEPSPAPDVTAEDARRADDPALLPEVQVGPGSSGDQAGLPLVPMGAVGIANIT